MKKHTFHCILLILFLIPLTAEGQKGKLNFDFSFSQQYWKMNQLNDFLIDANNPIKDVMLDSPYFKDGFKYQGQLSYQYSRHFNFGIYGNYQTAQATFEKNYTVYEPFQDVYYNYTYHFILQPESKSIGLNLGILYHEFFNFDAKSAFLKRLTLSNDLKFGIAQSKLNAYEAMIKPNKMARSLFGGKSNHIAGEISATFSYRFIDKQVFSAIGIHFGYQFLTSEIIHDRIDRTMDLSDGTSVNLDFSGVYFGVNLTIGK